jgi:hypothetical protein
MFRKSVSWLCIISACLFLSCTASKSLVKPKQAEIDQYLLDHPNLSPTDKSCLEDGRFEIGIHKETLLFLLKEPTKREEIKQPWAVQEKWIYRGHKVFIIEDNHVVGIIENR